jgi:hypothetical protein
MMVDPRCRQGISAVNREFQGDQPLRFRWIRFTDPQWGVFGTRAGTQPLLLVRAVLFVEFVATLVLSGAGVPDILLLTTTGFAVATMLSILHAGLNAAAQGS